MRRLLKRILVGLAIVMEFCETAGAQNDAVRVVYYPPWNISKLPMYLARDMGIFERNGLKIASKKKDAAISNGHACSCGVSVEFGAALMAPSGSG